MNISADTLNILMFLIPGLLSSTLLNTLVVRKEKDTFAKIAEALVFTFIIYAIIAPFIRESPIEVTARKVGEMTKFSMEYNWKALLWILGLSAVLPLVGGFLFTTDVHMVLLRFLRATGKTSRETIWLDVFSDQKRYVIANLKGGRRVFGWPMYYSNAPEEGMLYLYDPAWIDEETNDYIDLDIHGLLLVNEDIESIEFTWITEDNAEEKEEPYARATESTH